MPTVEIRITGDKALRQKLDTIQKAMPYKSAWAWRAAITTFFIPAVQQRILAYSPDLIWHGDLLNSFKIKSAHKEGVGVVVDIHAAEYAAEQEFGLIPKTIDRDRIVRWVMDKNGITDMYRAGCVADAVINKLQTVGIDARPFIVPALEDTKDLMVGYVFERVKAFVKQGS